MAIADVPVEIGFETALNAGLAGVRRTRIVAGVQALEICCAQGAHVANRVRDLRTATGSGHGGLRRPFG